MIVSKRAVCQYWLMYTILLMNQSVASMRYDIVFYYFIIAIALVICASFCLNLLSKKRLLYPMVAMVVSIFVTRFTGGSAGIGYVVIVFSNLFAALLAYEIDREAAPRRYVNTICFFAVISIIMFAFSRVAPDLVRNLLGLSFSQENIFSSGDGWVNGATWRYYGHIFYSFGREMNRNCGLYTEPGLYAIVIISAILVLLFRPEKTYFTRKQVTNRIILLTVTMITAASATGLIMAIIAFGGAYMVKRRQGENTTGFRYQNIVMLLGLVLLVALVDYFIRGEASFLDSYLLGKLTGLGFQRAVEMQDGSTGNARLIVLVQGIMAVIRYPLGAGTNRMSLIAQEFQSNYFNAGCGLAYFLGALGIFGWSAIVSIFITPLRSQTLVKKEQIVLLLIYILYGLSQANFWTSTLLIVVYIFEDDYYPEIEEYGWQYFEG